MLSLLQSPSIIESFLLPGNKALAANVPPGRLPILPQLRNEPFTLLVKWSAQKVHKNTTGIIYAPSPNAGCTSLPATFKHSSQELHLYPPLFFIWKMSCLHRHYLTGILNSFLKICQVTGNYSRVRKKFETRGRSVVKRAIISHLSATQRLSGYQPLPFLLAFGPQETVPKNRLVQVGLFSNAIPFSSGVVTGAAAVSWERLRLQRKRPPLHTGPSTW